MYSSGLTSRLKQPVTWSSTMAHSVGELKYEFSTEVAHRQTMAP